MNAQEKPGNQKDNRVRPVHSSGGRTVWSEKGPRARLIPPNLQRPFQNLVQTAVNGYLRESYGWDLPITHDASVPGLSIAVGDSNNNPVIADLVKQGLLNDSHSGLGEEGFRITTLAKDDREFLIVSAPSPTGLKHGCQELVFYRISADSGTATLDWPLNLEMTPTFPYRGAYMLPCWSAYDSLDSWKRALKFHSELTLNRNWFWLAGFPLIEKYGGEYAGSDLARPGNVRQLIDLCHSEGMEFYIGGGWFTWHHEKHARGSIECGIQYYLDMLDLFPDIDGIFLEPTGEGSTVPREKWTEHVSALKELVRTVRSRRSDFEFAIAVGEFNDREYRESLHQIDEKIYWWWCWGDPIRDNALAEHPRVLRWHIVSPMCDYHGSTKPPLPPETSLSGLATSYDPGQGFGNPWNGWGKLGVDHPRDFDPRTLPFFSHQYLFRERCWNVNLSDEEFAARLSRRIFDTDMPAKSIHHYLTLAGSCPDPKNVDPEVLSTIDEFVHSYSGKGTLRNQDTLRRMREAIDGIRSVRRENREHG
jgi:hypothetical protein